MEKRAESSSVHPWNISDKLAVTDAHTRGNSVAITEKRNASSSVQPRNVSDNPPSTSGGPQQLPVRSDNFVHHALKLGRLNQHTLLSHKYLQPINILGLALISKIQIQRMKTTIQRLMWTNRWRNIWTTYLKERMSKDVAKKPPARKGIFGKSTS
ncbi:hypothetical protein PIB30_090073 [Stylosanthes scabra]|uniref:Uncharacterized protein n=1 Tax=Stylosanthes scabra TaxID=79078 RepID=A0ABU6WXI2_9FABA|nr:hypothetical protein [Stylosanthes scabra]